MRVDPAHRVTERRTFLGVIAGGLLAAPLAAEAQPAGKVPRIRLPQPGPRPPAWADVQVELNHRARP
jgi:hypothetical protein